MLMKLVCPVCQGKNILTYWAMSGYKLAKCAYCEMVWDYNPPDNIGFHYDKSYFINDNPKGGYANYFEGMKINRRTFAERLQRIEKTYGKGILLDVGCALGDFLYEAKKRGWRKTYGIELSKYASGYAGKRGLNVKQGSLATNSLQNNYFDTITYQDVIEHLANPVGELKLAYKLLKKGGVIFLVTPDVGGLWKKLLGPLWYHYKPGEHVMYFSQKSLGLALKKAGFRNIRTKRTYHVMSVEYIVNRLKYYIPTLFEFLLKVARAIKIQNYSFRVCAGEFEAWGEKS